MLHRTMTRAEFSNNLDNPAAFRGGVIVTTEQKSGFFVCTAEEKFLELYETERLQTSLALARLVFAAREDVRQGKIAEAKDVLPRAKK
ncbi:hypothetical protein QTP81_16250 [Alteromonas sp. ASW11-36]|uniref:Prevent-host-death protein n=1 Tax=Alteromonas arenosi TaxID=3055817 RepID=A0ABT7T142_9ALTE|nr:hypothetical protein [Alteromonas sp. ASW11-36]MDM7862158.1 hypothetical protein [Alteromonas sp. ASW11-36]